MEIAKERVPPGSAKKTSELLEMYFLRMSEQGVFPEH